MYCLFVNVYFTTATGVYPIAVKYIISYQEEEEEEEEEEEDDDDDDDDDDSIYYPGLQLKLLFNDAFYKVPSQLSQLTLP